MSIHEEAIAKIQQLPEPLVVEINDFIDFLIDYVRIILINESFVHNLQNL